MLHQVLQSIIRISKVKKKNVRFLNESWKFFNLFSKLTL